MTILDVRNLNITITTRQGRLLIGRDISFRIQKGDTLGIIGESGSGKSILGQAILRMLPSSFDLRGEILYNQKNLLEVSEKYMMSIRGRHIAYIPQNSSLSLNPTIPNIHQLYEMFDLDEVNPESAWKKSLEIISSLFHHNGNHVHYSYPGELSKGMQQKLITGISMAVLPDLIIADEPTKGLDYWDKKALISQFKLIQKETGCSLFIITHDISFIEHVCENIAVLYAGEIVEAGETHKIFHSPLHPYTCALHDAMPGNGFTPLEGTMPYISEIPQRCTFHERCPYKNKCPRTEYPELTGFGNRKVRCHLSCYQ